MKTIRLLSVVLFSALTVHAQENIEREFMELAKTKGVEVTRSIDTEKMGDGLKKVCEVYTFSMPKKKSQLIQNVISAFNEDVNSEDCYTFRQYSSLQNSTLAPLETYHIAIGSKPESGRFVKNITIGARQGMNYVMACFMDYPNEGYRYCYAMEWQDVDENGKKLKTITGRLITTYSEIVDSKNNSFFPSDINLPQDGTFNFLMDEHNQILMTFLGIKTAIMKSREERIEQYCLLMKGYVEQHAGKITAEERELWHGELENLCNHIETKYFDWHSLGISYLRAAQKILKQTLE